MLLIEQHSSVNNSSSCKKKKQKTGCIVFISVAQAEQGMPSQGRSSIIGTEMHSRVMINTCVVSSKDFLLLAWLV